MIQDTLNLSELWDAFCQENLLNTNQVINDNQVTFGNRTMKFYYHKNGDKPKDGYALIFGLHGGGGCPSQLNDSQYQNHKHLYDGDIPDGTIWLVPRSCQDVWNMWFLQYIDDMFYKIIQAFTIAKIVNPNKVFLTGYSAGGDGIYHLVSRMADGLAGAAMMAGHPNGKDLISIRNVAFAIQVGQLDQSYNRNQQGRKYIEKLRQLQNQYGGFEQRSNVRQGHYHWMNKQQRQIFPWLFQQIRNPYPQLILLRQDPNRKKTFYYIQAQQRQPNQLIQVRKDGNKFYIKSNCKVIIFVNTKMIDFNNIVEIWHNGNKKFQDLPIIKNNIINKTLNQRKDPQYIFQDQFISHPSGPFNFQRNY